MFTGLVGGIGVVAAARVTHDGVELDIATPWHDVGDGESVAVDGACLTVASRHGAIVTMHVIQTTIERTGFGNYRPGRRVNLERALRATDRLGGHLVQGHVDGLGRVVRVAQQGDARLIDIAVPASVAGLAIPLGSIAVDGVSLTVNARPSADIIQVSLIPFTLERTTLGERAVGDEVHLEGDLVGKYIKQLTGPWRQDAAS